MRLFYLITCLLLHAIPTIAVFKDENLKLENSVAVYWGQATHAHPQKELGYYCQSSSIDTIILAFISVFGENFQVEESETDGFEINLSSFCSLDENGYHACLTLASDIVKCQELGKKVLLSLGGEQPEKGRSTYGFKSNQEAQEFAQKLWNYFGEGEDNAHRPFGDSLIDGFDIDAENEDQTGYLALVKELAHLSETKGTKKYYFSSAPQCTFPDKGNSELISNFELDYLFVQFYNNECKLNSEDYNYHKWSDHLTELGFNKTKIFLGLPSSKSSAVNGFIENVDYVSARVEEIKQNEQWRSHFGGLMFWDASKGFDPVYRDSSDDSYIYKVWKSLNGVTDPTGATVTDQSGESSGTKLSTSSGGSKATLGRSSIFLVAVALLFAISH